MAKVTAVIDIGSNSARLVIYKKSSRFAFHLLHEATSRVRLPEDAYKHGGQLQERAMKRTFNALEGFLNIASSFGVRKILCVATSALRDAPNKREFINLINRKLGLKIKVINGVDEAIFGARACLNLLPIVDAITVDIGGGSTEFAFIRNKTIISSASLPLGTVRLKELYFDNNDLKGAKQYIDEQLDKLPTEMLSNTIVGIGGTFRAIANSILKHKTYPLDILHGFEFNTKNMNITIKKILSADTKTLKKLNIKPTRYDTIKPGALIILQLLHKMKNVDRFITSGVGVREGVYLSDLLRNQNYKFPSNYNPSVRFLLDNFLVEKQLSNNLALLTSKIFDATHEYYKIGTKYKHALIVAAKLSPIGSSINFYSSNKHSLYLIQNSLEYGFTHQQIILIATLVRFVKRKSPSKAHLQEYQDILPDEGIVELLSFIITVSSALLTHRPKNVNYSISFQDRCLHVSSSDNIYLVKEALDTLQYPDNLSVQIDNY